MTYLDIPDLETVPGENGGQDFVPVADDLLQLDVIFVVSGKGRTGRRGQPQDAGPTQRKIHLSDGYTNNYNTTQLR